MQEAPINWEDLRFALAILRGGSLSAAARSLNVNQTTVSRRLTALEKRLGTPLFLRSRSGFRPTEAGELLVHRAERLESETIALAEEIGEATQQLRGAVRISTMPWIVNYVLVPKLFALANTHPGISIHAISGLRERSLGKREAELSLRFEMQPRRGELCIPIVKVSYSVYAPRGRDESSLPWLGFAESGTYLLPEAWLDAHRSRHEPVAFRANDIGIVHEAARNGLGKALLPDVLGEKDDTLVRISGPKPELTRELRVLVHRDMRDVARVAAVIDWLQSNALAALRTSTPA